jgi:hypothetical protein
MTLLEICEGLELDIDEMNLAEAALVPLEATGSLLLVACANAFMNEVLLGPDDSEVNTTGTEGWIATLVAEAHGLYFWQRDLNISRHIIAHSRNDQHGPWQPAIRCQFCEIFMPGPHVFKQHVLGRNEVCAESRVVLKQLTQLGISRVPAALLTKFAHVQQIEALFHTHQHYAPRICSHCKCWIENEAYIQWHKTDPDLCYKALKREGCTPRLTTMFPTASAMLGLTARNNNISSCKPHVLWKHAITGVLRRRFKVTSLCHLMWAFVNEAANAKVHIPPLLLEGQLMPYLDKQPLINMFIGAGTPCKQLEQARLRLERLKKFLSNFEFVNDV